MAVKLTGPLLTYPARAAFTWYLGLIGLGTVLLLQPLATAPGRERLSVLDALFTATSAACVTGLTVRSTAHDLSLFGQAVVLGLIQLGGIGIMTVTTFFSLRFGRESLRHRIVLAQTLGGYDSDLRTTLWNVIRLFLVCEAIGFALLALRNLMAVPSWNGIWEALFHSISAFCNAGFALHDSSLAPHQGDVLVNLTIMALIIVGGLGFPVVSNVWRAWRDKRRQGWSELTVHTRLMLIGSAALLAGGFVAFLALEWNNALLGMPLWRKLLVASFQSTTTRTAGFETVPVAWLTSATLFTMMLLMLIGGGPCSTAGGFKVSTLAVLVCHAWSRFRGSSRVNVFRRSIAPTIVDSAMATALLFGVVGALALTGVLIADQSYTSFSESEHSFLDLAFEVCSALGTVGLSTGITPHLDDLAKLVVVVLMFLGRLGPISVFVALSVSQRRELVEYPKEEVLVG